MLTPVRQTSGEKQSRQAELNKNNVNRTRTVGN